MMKRTVSSPLWVIFTPIFPVYDYHPLCVSRGTVSHECLHTQTSTSTHMHTHRHMPLTSARMWKQRDHRTSRSFPSSSHWLKLKPSYSTICPLIFLLSHLQVSICLSIWGWLLLRHFRKLLFFFFKNLWGCSSAPTQ